MSLIDRKPRRTMKKYGDPCGNSGVSTYEIGDDSIRVRFKSGDIYVYDYRSAGRASIERMKRLAEEGTGLTTYISQHVRENYAEKVD
jgi:hypothetical protein